ncbi:hypothetical protein GCK72_005900 [Caenorhabditis remanei]|uniref:MSP domain-containing protein n=1 Tax=Caenorhabditis remanei TaxID=31234 RepID=A0A6A5HGJ6_CAERE|nr:hypothetical protein GCK72_005900 [Caenorhabditis remanei]KAF1765947.1 hypothetical protein GCK72_005900 [Caenorhabditis remanei]
MQRPERIRFFITEQCRLLDPSYRNYMWPKQILLGDTPLPLAEGSPMIFRINDKKKISFRIVLESNDHGGPIGIGFPLSQIESVSIKDRSQKHPEHAIVFLLSNSALEKLNLKFGTLLDDPISNGNRRSMSKYLTVIVGANPSISKPNNVYCRVILSSYKFTFSFLAAKKILLKDLPIMWHKLLEDKEERFKVVAIQTDRERIAEMNDEAWDWLMTYLKVKWETCPIQGSWLVKEEPNRESSKFNEIILKREPPSLLSDEFLESKPPKRLKYSDSTGGSPASVSSEYL